MSHRQLKSPNLAVVGQSGWCLAYVTEVFGIAPHYPSAIAAWQNASYKHTEQPPGDVAVPVFFSYNGPYGHVAVSVPGRGIWSTSAQGDKVFGSVNELVRWMGEGFQYLGWSEDLNNVRVMDTVSDAPPAPLFTVEAITPREVKVQPGHQKWNLAYGNFEDVRNNPITTSDNDTHFTARAVLHHREIPQYNYYLEDPNTPHGWNVLDCIDYVAPPPPYVPPAAPVEVKQAEKYTLLTTVMAFETSDAATWHKGVATAIGPGDYFVISKKDKSYNLSDDNMKDRNQWVNIDDNIVPTPTPPRVIEAIKAAAENIPVNQPEPVSPAPWKPNYTPLRSDRQPIIYKSKNAQDYPIVDYSTNRPTIYMPPKHTVKAVDQFSDAKGIVYYRSESMAAENLGYGVPKALLEEAVFDTELTRAERLAMKSANLVDKAYYTWIKGERNMRWIDGIKQAVRGITEGKKR